MRAQVTSAIALQEEVASGRLAGRLLQVALAFQVHGPGTSAEVLTKAGLDDNLNLNRARVTDLRDAGWLTKIETRRCMAKGVPGRLANVLAFQRCEPRATEATVRWTRTEARAAAVESIVVAREALAMARAGWPDIDDSMTPELDRMAHAAKLNALETQIDELTSRADAAVRPSRRKVLREVVDLSVLGGPAKVELP